MLVYTAHLESGGNDTLRRKQLDEMVRDQRREARPEERVVLAGDVGSGQQLKSRRFVVRDRAGSRNQRNALDR
jgi:hypothetical protein